MRPVYLNGRFLSQPVTGVQRFAREITACLDRRWPSSGPPPPTVLVPRLAQAAVPAYRAFPVTAVGHLGGHLWEQLDLPRYARGGVLVNLANLGPILGPIFATSQLVVLHDAGVFAHPEAYSLPYGLFHRGMDRILARSGTRLATVSRFSRGELARYLATPANDIALVPEGADHILRVDPDEAILGRHELTARRYVLAVGSLAAHKNIGALGPLAEALSRRGVALVIVGGFAAPVFGRLPSLPQPATYLGRVGDGALRALFENAACFVFPSRYEGFGIPPLEAMACHCPVVAAGAGAVREVCGDAALYADPDDLDGIAATVCRVLDDADLAADLRQRGRALVATLTWDKAAAALLPIIEQLRDDLAKAPEHEGSDRP